MTAFHFDIVALKTTSRGRLQSPNNLVVREPLWLLHVLLAEQEAQVRRNVLCNHMNLDLL